MEAPLSEVCVAALEKILLVLVEKKIIKEGPNLTSQDRCLALTHVDYGQMQEVSGKKSKEVDLLQKQWSSTQGRVLSGQGAEIG